MAQLGLRFQLGSRKGRFGEFLLLQSRGPAQPFTSAHQTVTIDRLARWLAQTLRALRAHSMASIRIAFVVTMIKLRISSRSAGSQQDVLLTPLPPNSHRC